MNSSQFLSANSMQINGVLLIDKPSGPTSHDIVDNIRKHFGFRKVGHAGTLDPQANGLLVLMIGKATKLASILATGDKVYVGTMKLGCSTDTQDKQGKIIKENDYSYVTKQNITDKFNEWTGDVMQTPPMVSAVKKNGVPLYKLARKGKEIKRESKLIHIYKFDMLEFKPPFVKFYLNCSKGVYVRTLCSDIGDSLGCNAYLEDLQRKQSSDFKLENAISFKECLTLTQKELADRVIPPNRIDLNTGQIK
jgi:tRNA pseudouridine55 synthase